MKNNSKKCNITKQKRISVIYRNAFLTVDKAPETRQNIINRIMPPLIYKVIPPLIGGDVCNADKRGRLRSKGGNTKC